MFTAIRSRLSFANVIAMMALFIALGGGVFAAARGNKITSNQIKGKPALAFAHYSASGNRISGFKVPATATKPAAAPGVYCLKLGFTPRSGVASARHPDTGIASRIAHVNIPPNTGAGPTKCPAGTSAEVVVTNATGVGMDTEFQVMFD